MVNALSHLDDFAGVGISSERVKANALCHPDNKPHKLMSPG